MQQKKRQRKIMLGFSPFVTTNNSGGVAIQKQVVLLHACVKKKASRHTHNTHHWVIFSEGESVVYQWYSTTTTIRLFWCSKGEQTTTSSSTLPFSLSVGSVARHHVCGGDCNVRESFSVWVSLVNHSLWKRGRRRSYRRHLLRSFYFRTTGIYPTIQRHFVPACTRVCTSGLSWNSAFIWSPACVLVCFTSSFNCILCLCVAAIFFFLFA